MRGSKRSAAIEAPYLDMLREFKRNEKKTKLEQQAQADLKSRAVLARDSTTDFTASMHSALDLESESDSDLGFEDVDIDAPDSSGDENSIDNLTDLNISLDSSKVRHLIRTKHRGLRKPQRLALHKIGLMAWILHAQQRNKWLCEPDLLNSDVFKSMLPESVLLEIHAPEHLTAFLKSKKLVSGLEHAMKIWRAKFSVVRSGLSSRGQEFGDVVAGFTDFKCMLLSLSGSTDMLGQGYVALVRSLNLKARLVCSLQPPDNLQTDSAIPSNNATSVKSESNCPLYWAEVWDPYTTRWIVVDPLTGTIRLPTRSKTKLKIEPPLNDQLNILRYCIGFNNEGFARDVTRRYAYAYNARTRKKRLPYVESEEWLDKLLGIFCQTNFTSADRDELIELNRYPKLEGIPSRIQDFVGHPEYALADQLHRNEVLRPGAQPCGVLSQKPSKSNMKMTAQPNYIYKRSDVLAAKSSQSWYRLGREIKMGAQPRAHRPMKNRLTGEEELTALYTFDQTVLYDPPVVADDGTVPKSEYRTVDIFTPNMIPKGATHLSSKLAIQAAKILKIDYANAVVGVEFGKRGPHSTIQGIVIADQYVEAVTAVIHALEDIERVRANRFNTIRILKLWRQFIMGIQIWERVEYMNPTENSNSDRRHEELNVDEGENTKTEQRQDFDSRNPPDFKTARKLRNFRALLRKNVPVKSHNVTTQYAVDKSRIEQIKQALRNDAVQDSYTEVPKPPDPIHYPELTEASPNDSFDDLDVDEISESEL